MTMITLAKTHVNLALRSRRWAGAMLFACLASLGTAAQVSIAAQEPIDGEEETAQSPREETGANEIEAASEDEREAQAEAQEAEEAPEEIDDFIPSEMISEDLAVDMPIDI